ncbi:conjugative transposon protein TraM [Salinimicrobium sp. WS361]|uniref:conjugative transposon protein TraM n=1 Tax=Salinimicrobium sp. WS361 TaxID=3425123 RepID=UPI003D6F1104
MKLDKKKVVFVCIIIIVLLFISGYTMLIFMDQEVSESLQQPSIPQLEEEQETYSSKIEAVDAIKEERERNIPNVYSQRYLDSLDAYAPAIEQEEREWMIDSTVRFGIVESEQSETKYREEESSEGILEFKEVQIPGNVPTGDLSAGHANFFISAVTSRSFEKEKNNSETLIKAEVNGTQTLRSGDRLELILTEDAQIQENFFPKNTLLYGFVSLQLNRVHIKITHLNETDISLKAFDLQDNNEGIYVQNSFKTEAGKEVLDDLVQDINIAGLPQIGGVKNIFRKSNRKLKVTILDQYQLLLKAE